MREDCCLDDSVQEAAEGHFGFVGYPPAAFRFYGVDGSHVEEEIDAHRGRTTGDA